MVIKGTNFQLGQQMEKVYSVKVSNVADIVSSPIKTVELHYIDKKTAGYCIMEKNGRVVAIHNQLLA